MEVNYLRDISDFLGKEDKRYFSYGFKFFDYQYEDLCYEDKVLSGNVITNYYWENKNNRHLHLGTTEYIAISSTICEQILLTEFHLTPGQISLSWISSFRIKIRSCINILDNNKIALSGRLVATEKEEKTTNSYKSSIVVKVNNTIIRVEVIHPVSLFIRGLNHSVIKVEKSGLYHSGYRMRSHSIKDIYMNENLMECDAAISINDYYYQRSGLGSAFRGTLLTDIILISGQMVQTLFFCLEKINRETANNIWLKEFSITIDKPNNEMDYQAKLSFENIEVLKKDNETWKSVQFRSELGGMQGNIKMVSQVGYNEKNCNYRN